MRTGGAVDVLIPEDRIRARLAELGRQINYFLDGISLADVIGRRVSGRAVALRNEPIAAE